MKTAMTTRKLFATAIALVVAAALWFSWGQRPAQAIQDSEDHPSPIGLTNGQTARLTALNRGQDRGIIIICRFLDSEGRTLSETPEPHLLLPGHMSTFDLNADNINASRIGSFGRIQVLGVVRAVGDANDKNLHVSLEVFDNATGKTTVFVPPALVKGFNPQPDPPDIRK
jgi:hypothetical protein